MSDPTNTRGVPGPDEEADMASGGAPERSDASAEGESREQDEKPSGGGDQRASSSGTDAQGAGTGDH